MNPPTRDVVVDLWPLYVSGEASADTRALVEAFLAQEPELGERLRGSLARDLAPPALALPVDHERETLLRTQRRRARQSMVVNSLALLVSGAMTAFFVWGLVPRWAFAFAGAGLPLPPAMQAAAKASAWILRLGVPLAVLLVPAAFLFRKRMRLPRVFESGTLLAAITGIALVLAQLVWLTLLNEASFAIEAVCRALPAVRP